MVHLEVSINDADVIRMLSGIEGRGKNLQPAMKAIGEYVVRRTEERFENEQDPEGNPWKPLSKATLKRKKGTKILTESSNLRDRVTYDADSDSVRVGTVVIYSAVHQKGIGRRSSLGTRREMPAIPARPFLGANDEDQKEFAEIVREHLLRG